MAVVKRPIVLCPESFIDVYKRQDLDRDLHLKIAQISDNPLILSVLNASAQITENMIVGIRSYLCLLYTSRCV